jgi:hypothetical protein
MNTKRRYFKMKRSIIFSGLALGALLLASGCATSGVTIKQTFTDEQRANAEKLVTQWNEFDIYFYEWGGQVPAVLLFDIKKDDKRLRVGNDWTKITSQQQLLAAIESGKMWKTHAVPRMAEIIGPDGVAWGYAVTLHGQVFASVADERTIDISPPKDPRPPR